MADKVCVLCKHLEFDPGYPDYSEYTPGEDWSSGCTYNRYNDGQQNPLAWSTDSLGRIKSADDYRKFLLTANDCKFYDEVE